MVDKLYGTKGKERSTYERAVLNQSIQHVLACLSSRTDQEDFLLWCKRHGQGLMIQHKIKLLEAGCWTGGFCSIIRTKRPMFSVFHVSL